jgi:hypothetical protein
VDFGSKVVVTVRCTVIMKSTVPTHFDSEERGEPRSTDDPTDSGFPPARWGVWAYSPGLRSPSE